MHLILLALLCGGSALSSEVSSLQKECAKGATYWCKNLVTAIQCGALDHCLQTGWIPDTNDTCTDCKQIVTILIRMVKESSLKKAIQNYLKQECNTLVPELLTSRCQDLVDTYYDLFLTSLEKQIKPTDVCANLGLCSSDLLGILDIFGVLVSEVKQLLWLLQGHAPSSDAQSRTFTPDNWAKRHHNVGNPGEELPIPLPTCWMCRSIVGRLESTVPTGAIATSLAQICRLMPGSMSGMCQCLAEKYTAIIVEGIMGKLGPRLICGMMLMCTTEENADSEIPQADKCQTCLTVNSQMKTDLKANSTKGEREAVLLSACSRTSLDRQECNSFIEQHHPKLLALLAKPWSSQTTCQELGACVAEGPFSGATGCAQGPAYWCSSLRAAKECEAVQHCQAHVWQ